MDFHNSIHCAYEDRLVGVRMYEVYSVCFCYLQSIYSAITIEADRWPSDSEKDT